MIGFGTYVTGLMYAASYNRESIVDILLENGADVNKTKDGKQSSALMLACTNENAQIVKKLLQRRANINYTNMFGESAFIISCINQNEDVIMTLLDFEADVSIRYKGQTGYDLLYKYDYRY